MKIEINKSDKWRVTSGGQNVRALTRHLSPVNRHPSRPARRKSGFTLTELMLVVVIIGILAALVIPRIAGSGERARNITAGADINGGIKSALGNYEVDMGSYPHSLQDLITAPSNAKGWHGPYLDKLPIDPWGNPYIYYFPGKHGAPGSYDLLSAGFDGKEGTDDDVVNWAK